MEKNGPSLPHFKEFLFQSCQIFMISEVCSQIWLNHLMDDHQFSYITKLKKKTLMTSICEPKKEVLFYNNIEPSEAFIEHAKSTKTHQV
jgi:hypothetical protein